MPHVAPGVRLPLLLLASVAGASSALAQCGNAWIPQGGVPGVDSRVNAMALWDSDGAGSLPPLLVVQGTFHIAGDVSVEGMAAFEPMSTTWSGFGGTTGGAVTALTTLPNGDLVGFAPPSGATTTHDLVRWNGTSWSVLATGMDDYVYAVAAMPNGDLIAGGEFTTAGGVPVKGIARWNGVAWSPLGAGIEDGSGGPGVVAGVTVMPNGDVVASGSFAVAGGSPASNIARWNGSSWSALGAGVDALEYPGVFAAVVLPNGDLVVGGTFTTAGGAPAAGIARWNGTNWSGLGSGVTYGFSDARVRALAVSPAGELLVGGLFSAAGGIAASGIAKWNGSTWASLGSGVDVEVLALSLLPNGDLIAAGDFSGAGTADADCIARWDGTTWSALNPGTNERIQTLHVRADGSLVAGGLFTTIRGVAANYIARWDGTSWSSLGSGVAANPLAPAFQVTTLASLANGDLVAGGSFPSAGGVPGTSKVARWNGSSWSALGTGITPSSPTDYVACSATLPTGDLIVGGSFSFAGGGMANRIARWNGSAWSKLGGSPLDGGGANGDVVALTVRPNGDLIAGGYFTLMFNSSGAVNANRIARWNGTAWSAMGTGLNGPVLALVTLADGDVVVGGDFTTAGGLPANRIARWNGTTWSALGSGMDDYVSSLIVLPDGDLLASGAFTMAGGVAANSLARWNGSSWSAPVAGLTHGLGVAFAALTNGDVMVGGSFLRAGGAASAYLARLTTTCPALATSFAPGCPSSGGNNLLTATALPWVEGVFRAKATGLPISAIVLQVTGLTAFVPGFPLSLAFVEAQIGCDIAVSLDILGAVVTANGTAETQLSLPNSPPLLGVTFYHQMVPFELAPGGGFASITATNALQLTVGSF